MLLYTDMLTYTVMLIYAGMLIYTEMLLQQLLITDGHDTLTDKLIGGSIDNGVKYTETTQLMFYVYIYMNVMMIDIIIRRVPKT